MPSITTYTPYETLAFFQSIAKHGSDASTLQDISATLAQNEFIRQSSSYDADKLSTNALRGLYGKLMQEEKARRSTKINGEEEDGERSPKRRKLSASPQPGHDQDRGEHHLVQAIIERSYLKYKEDVIGQIRQDEAAYTSLQKQIEALKSEVDADNKRSENSVTLSAGQTEQLSGSQQAESGEQRDRKSSVPEKQDRNDLNTPTSDQRAAAPLLTQSSSDHVPPAYTQPQVRPAQPAQPSPTPSASAITAPHTQPVPQPNRGSQPPAQPQPSPSTFTRNLPVPATSQRPSYGSIQSQAAYSTPHQPASAQAVAHVSQQKPPIARQSSGHNITSPAPPQNQHPYPPYAQYHPQWHPHMAQQYQQVSGYAHQYYPPPIPAMHPQTPQQPAYPPYPHTTQAHYGHPNWRGQQYPHYPASAATTPVSRPASRTSVTRSGSSTPWKKKAEIGPLRTKSPARPERDVSPLTDGDSPPADSTVRRIRADRKGQRRGGDETPTQPARSARRGRPPSKTPSAMGPSRSQSIASHASETANEGPGLSRRSHKIKAEPPSTPLPPPSDTEQPQRSSGRRGRPRTNTMTSEVTRTGPNKRKRESISPSPSMRSPYAKSVPSLAKSAYTLAHDPSLIIVSRSFSKTSQLLLNEITSHKLASIFAKPLSERDAPGYKELIFRAQDLKSIKAAISKGTRAALVAIEAMESLAASDDHEVTNGTDNEETARNGNATPAGPTAAKPRAIGNGFFLVPKTLDLIPPRGIVNSAQLEMELMRMFANAIMFNPLPPSERGFGKALRLRRGGGDVDSSEVRKRRSLRRRAGRRRRLENGDDVVEDSEAASGEDGDSDNDDKDRTDPRSSTGSVGDAEDSSQTSSNSETGDGPATGGIGWDEGGIIADTREMFEDVVEMVGKWRSLEEERMGIATTASTGGTNVNDGNSGGVGGKGRQNSIPGSASSNIGEEEVDAVPTPATITPAATARKRRRITDH